MTVVRPAREEDVEAAAAMLNEHSRRLHGTDDLTPADLLMYWTSPDVELGQRRPARRERGRPARRLCGPRRPRRRRLAGRQGHRSRDSARAARGDRAAGDRRKSRTRSSGATPPPTTRRSSSCSSGRATAGRATRSACRSTSTEICPGPSGPTASRSARCARARSAGSTRRKWRPSRTRGCSLRTRTTVWLHWMVEEPSFDRSLWFVAEQDGELAGIILSRAPENEPGLGWVRILGVLPEYRQRGLGQALLQHTFAEFARRGFTAVGLGVDAENPTGRGSCLRAGRDARRADEPDLREASGIIEASWPSHT